MRQVIERAARPAILDVCMLTVFALVGTEHRELMTKIARLQVDVRLCPVMSSVIPKSSTPLVGLEFPTVMVLLSALRRT